MYALLEKTSCDACGETAEYHTGRAALCDHCAAVVHAIGLAPHIAPAIWLTENQYSCWRDYKNSGLETLPIC